MLIFIEKSTNRVSLYGSLVKLYDSESHLIKIAFNTMNSKRDLDLEDYEDELCRICKREVIRKEHAKSQFL